MPASMPEINNGSQAADRTIHALNHRFTDPSSSGEPGGVRPKTEKAELSGTDNLVEKT
jgi:hypothetical protein